MNQHIFHARSLIWFILFATLTGCAQATATSLPPTSIPNPTSIPPTNTFSVTQTIVPSLTPTPTSIPSRPIPMPIAENTGIALELLRTNNGCDLPCWWGIVPNQTSWSDAQKFLTPFSNIYERQPPNEWFVYDVRSPLPMEHSDTYSIHMVFATQEGLVKEIEIKGFNEKPYSLSAILSKYGIPSQVLVSTYSSDIGLPPNQVFLSIDIHYSEKGINVLYGTTATVTGSQIKGCGLEYPHLFLWSPNEHNRSIDYILGWDKSNTPYLDIEEATGKSIKEFFEIYSITDSENEACIETSTSLWPAQ